MGVYHESRNNKLPTHGAPSEGQIIEDSINSLRDKINLYSRIVAHRRAGKNAASVLVAMQKDVADAQREVVQHHANLIARARKMELTDRFQAGLTDLTRRVDERTATESKHYWEQLAKRLDHYEEFFETRIRELKAKVTSGEMTQERATIRISQYEKDRDGQQEQDRLLLSELRDANLRVVRKALTDYQPT